MTINRFVAGGNVYTFPTSPGDQEFHTNFKELTPHTTRIIGVSGGFDELGIARAPSAIGNVQFSTYLVSPTKAGMQALRDSLNRMADWGAGLLYDTINGTDRWCYARVNNIDEPEQRHESKNDLWQKVTLSFQVADPFWYTFGTMGGYLLGINFVLGTATLGSGSPTTVTGLTNDLAVTNNGSAFTLPNITIEANTAKTVTNPTVQLIKNSAIVASFTWIGTLNAGEQLWVDPRSYQVLAVGVNAYNAFTFTTADWMRLTPGSNTVRFLFSSATDEAKVYIRYYERYT